MFGFAGAKHYGAGVVQRCPPIGRRGTVAFSHRYAQYSALCPLVGPVRLRWSGTPQVGRPQVAPAATGAAGATCLLIGGRFDPGDPERDARTGAPAQGHLHRGICTGAPAQGHPHRGTRLPEAHLLMGAGQGSGSDSGRVPDPCSPAPPLGHPTAQVPESAALHPMLGAQPLSTTMPQPRTRRRNAPGRRRTAPDARSK